MESLEVDDLIVLLLGAPSQNKLLRDRLEGITRLEKLIFLLDQESDIGDLVKDDIGFESHNFGPFSKKVYQELDTLAAAGLIEDSSRTANSTEDAWELEQVIGTELSDPYSTRNFVLTKRGKNYYRALISSLPPEIEPELTRFKEMFASIPLRQLVRYVYERYPTYTDKSLIRDEILGT